MAEELTFFQMCGRLGVEPYKAKALISEGWLPKGVKRGATAKVWAWEDVQESDWLTRPPEPMPTHVGPERVYFLEMCGLIKIGYSAAVENRLYELERSLPFPTTVLHVTPGSRDTEAYYHHLFREANFKGEWFKATDELLAFIQSLKNGAEPFSPERRDSARASN